MKKFRTALLAALPVLFLAVLFQSCGSKNDNPTNPGPQPTDTPTNTSTVIVSSTQTTSSTATHSPTYTPTFAPTDSTTPTPSPTSTNTATPADTATPTNTATFTATSTATPTPSNSPTHTSTGTPTITPTFTSTGTPTNSFTVTATYTVTNSPTITPTPNRTVCSVMTPFGDPNTASTSQGYFGAPQFIYSLFTYSGTGSATLWDVQLYMFALNNSALTLQCAVYDQLTGDEIGLSAVTVINTITSGWVTFPMTPQTILPGRSYILAFNLIGNDPRYLPIFDDDTTTKNNDFYVDGSISTTPSNYTGHGIQNSGTLNIFADICP